MIYLRLEAGGLRMLPVSARREVAETIRQTPKADFVRIGDESVLTVEIKHSRRHVESQLTQLARMEMFVVSRLEIMGGTPVFKGTRIPVDVVADMLAQGATVEEISDGYPALIKQKIKLTPRLNS